jgi:hypothetical protein
LFPSYIDGRIAPAAGSLISIVQAVSELTTVYPADVELKAAVTNAWGRDH